MPHWYLKAAIQGVLSRLPEPQRYNRLFQRHVTRSLQLADDQFLGKWRQCERHIATFQEAGGTTENCVVAELGTGWFPTTTVGLALCGAREVISVDPQPLVDREQLIAVLELYQRHLESKSVALPCGGTDQALDRIAALLARPGSVGDMMARLGVRLLVTDARSLDLPDRSIDFFVSNNTLEHIPGDVLLDILREFHRLARDDAVMSHLINMADHYRSVDTSISVYNFLRFSERRWKKFNNALHYQNRLRVSDFRRIHAEAGWELVGEDSHGGPVEVLRSVSLAPEFRHYKEEDLLVYRSWMISRPSRS
ncbi:MAG: class I SAM-dependent methyltransferase [Gammaproteobacteria bacterium]|nr:class I SAM-dependent methyltransferase [Gammaproteobacteria bacterium]